MGSNRITRSLKLFFIVFASLVLLSSSWVLQVSGAVSSTIQTVDGSGKMGSYLCLALDSKGNPGISYYDFTNYNLKYAHWNGVNWDVQTVDNSFFCGLHTALTFDANDNPYISYDGQSSLMCAHWTGSKWDIQFVDVQGSFTSIAIDANGYPHISYYSVGNGADLKYASWTGSGWSLQTIDSYGNIGEFTSLKLDNSGYPHISYLDISNLDLKVAWQDSSGWHCQTVDSNGDVGFYSSIVLDSNGNSYISYFDNASRDLKYAYSNGSEWSTQVIESSGDVGTDTSIALDSSGNPHISYTDTSNHVLKYASWNGSAWNIISLFYAGYVGEYTSLANDQTSLVLDKNDKVHLAYCDWGNYWLKYIYAPDQSGLATKYVQPAASLKVNLNPVGVGQTITVNMSLVPRPPSTNDRFSNVTLSIANPDGTSNYLGPFLSDSSGFIYVSYVPTQVGNYSMQLKYGGQFFMSNNATYYPTQSQVLTLKVQQEPVFPSPSPSPSPMPVSNSTQSQPTPTPRSFPIQNLTTVPVTTANGTIVNLSINGNITSYQMSNISLATNQSSKTTILSFTVQGRSGNTGFSNITIPKNNLLNGTTPIVYIDNHPAQNQGYTQDNDNIYLWYTTSFSIHQISIQFIFPFHPTPTPTNQPSGITLTEIFSGVIYGSAIAATVIAIFFLTIFVKKKQEK